MKTKNGKTIICSCGHYTNGRPAPIYVEGATAEDFHYTDFACEACILKYRGEKKIFGVDYAFETDSVSPAAVFGKKGGSVKSAKKAASSAANGVKGGRPRKIQQEPDTCPNCNRPMHKFHHCEYNPVANPIICSE